MSLKLVLSVLSTRRPANKFLGSKIQSYCPSTKLGRFLPICTVRKTYVSESGAKKNLSEPKPSVRPMQYITGTKRCATDFEPDRLSLIVLKCRQFVRGPGVVRKTKPVHANATTKMMPESSVEPCWSLHICQLSARYSSTPSPNSSVRTARSLECGFIEINFPTFQPNKKSNPSRISCAAKSTTKRFTPSTSRKSHSVYSEVYGTSRAENNESRYGKSYPISTGNGLSWGTLLRHLHPKFWRTHRSCGIRHETRSNRQELSNDFSSRR